MNRRRVLTAGVTVMVGAYVAGRFAAVHNMAQFAEQDMAGQLQAFKARALTTTGRWTPGQVFTHLAQSIEYSLTGYPQVKPAWFQHTAGAAAFSAFLAAGAMHHNLAEPIPGAPSLDDLSYANAPDPSAPDANASTTDAALERLVAALRDFEAHTGRLAPHFAYGELDKRQYRAAHLMHIQNHFQELRA